jgi:LysR family transcriptional regulator, glycine cleavage system transcriptional activator
MIRGLFRGSLSFKRAAGELGVTPTAVSHQIRLLEQFCGQPLFRRQPRPLQLTAAGERLFPAIRDGLNSFAAGLSAIRGTITRSPLRVTATNAFAFRWLVPRLPNWRRAHPAITLEVIGTDTVIDLVAGDADVAIRYARRPPRNLIVHELFRDEFQLVCSPSLLTSRKTIRTPVDLLDFPLIDYFWTPSDRKAPTWRRLEAAARTRFKRVPDLANAVVLSFREELHAIEAVLAAQGIAICSDVLVGEELNSGQLVRLFDITLPGYGFYLVYRPHHPRQRAITIFREWLSLMT